MERIYGKIKRFVRQHDGNRVTAKLMSALLIASSVLNAFAPMAAYAAEPDLATVSVSETEHGKLSFDGDDKATLAVEVGTDVTVNVTPDDGYFADTITVFTGEEDGEAVDVKDGKATFTVEGDTVVTSTFYQNGSLGSAPLKAADVDEGKAAKSVEDYIRKNADAKYVGKSDDIARADVLTVTTSVVDGSKLPDATLDSLWADENGDGFSEHWDALMSQAVSHAVLFEADPASDYYVGWAGADIADAKLTDWGAAENNADAKMRDGFIVDDATGLVYVPKSYTEKDDSGKPMVASSRIQLLYTAKDANAEATFDFDATSDGVSGDVSGKGKVTVPATSPTTEVVIANDSEARKAVNGRTIDSVTVNGIEYTPDMGMWQYDSETGALEFAMAPAGIHAMSVKMSDGFGKDIASFFRMPEPRMSVNEIGTWEFKTAPTVGATFVTKGHNRYSGKTRPGYTLPAVENPAGGRYENKTINQAMGWQPVNLDALKAGNYSIEWTSEIWAQDTGWVKIGNEARVALTCGHVGVDPNFNSNPGYNDTAHTDNNHGQHIRVFSVSGNEAIIGVTVPTAMTQAGAGFFRIRWRIGSGKLKIHKASANASITNGNDCYSLEGAEFAVLNAAGQNMGTLRTNANGDTNTIELPEGTYTVRETKAPKGYLKAPDQQVAVHGGQTATAQVSDQPADDPMVMLVGKYDGDKTYNAIEGNMPQGAASLAGAEFTVEYYDTVDYGSYDALKKAGVRPTRSWVVRTDEDGYARLSESYLVHGDPFYYNGNVVTMPRGSVVVRETKAPEGYKLNNEVSFQKIQEKPLDAVITFNAPQVPDSVIRGGVAVQKQDSQTGTAPQGQASLKGIEFSIINDSANAVTVDGKSYGHGQTVKTIVTDGKGHAATSGDCLPYGDYIIRETKTNDSYQNTAQDMHVQVRESGKVYKFTANDDIVRGGVEVVKHDIENDSSDPLGAASLDGTKFEVKTQSDNPVMVEGVSYSKGEVVKTLTVKDGHAATSGDCLPYGSYTLQEVKAGEGYLLTDGKAYKFDVRHNGDIVNPVDGGSVRNQVKRSDFEFTKKADDTADRLANVPFKMTSKTTGESHVVVTDGNGYFSSASSWNEHTHETNANDWALSEQGVIDSSRLDASAGIWFGGTDPDDGKGALPYDTYTLTELPCTNNEGYQMVSTSIIIDRDGKVYDFGTLDDVKSSITTKAFDPADNDSSIGVGDVRIADTVSYANLKPGKAYTLEATLHDSETGDAIDGFGTTQEFTAQEATGTVTVRFDIDSTDLRGKTVTVYEKLYDENHKLVAEHTDKDDVNQQLKVVEPRIGTVALDTVDGDKHVSTSDTASVTDTVSYKNLVPGEDYTLLGALFLKKTDKDGRVSAEPLMSDGKPVVGVKVFTPEEADGTADVTFGFDSRDLKDGTQLVAYEALVDVTGEPRAALTDEQMQKVLDILADPSADHRHFHVLASHTDASDMNQTVTIKNPRISTTAVDGLDKDKNVVTDDESTVVDTVAYENLIPGKEYTVKGTLHSKETGDPLEVDGKPVKAETVFTPEEADGTVDVTFTFDSRDLKDKSELVVFESLELGGKEVVSHKDIDDVNQTVTVTAPRIGTVAVDGIDGDKDVVADDESTIVDTVEYRNLVPGKEYTVKGTLHSKETGDPLEVDGTPVKAETAFTPENPDGTVEVTFTFDSREIEDMSQIVVFESLELGGKQLASHEDIEDGKQTVTVTHPEIGTTATDSSDGDKNVITDDETEIIDTVEYTGLVPGKEYTVKGTLHVKKTDKDGNVSEEPLTVDGEPVTAQTVFTPKKADGTVDVVFRFNSLNVPHDTEIVAFESLEKNGVEIAAHADIEDKGQTVTVKHPFITTSALDGIDGDKNIVTDDETVIIDTVKYSGLIPGREYALKGSMQVKKTDKDGNVTAEPLEVDGTPVKAETAFTPDTASGEVEVRFEFDSRRIEDKTPIVVFESLERSGVEIAAHADIEDGKQTTEVTRPQIGTTARDGHDADKQVVTDGKTVIVDTVEYKNVVPGKEYTVKGTLHVKKTDKDGNVSEEPLTVDGEPVTAQTVFTPEKPDGTVDVTFTFDASAVEEGTEIVAFESLEKNGVELTTHSDIEDANQTTTAHVTQIGTVATDGIDGDKTVIADAETVITDEVGYENALTDTDYTMAGILMDAETGLPILTGDGSEKYTDKDVATFMQKLLDALGLSTDDDEGTADVPVYDLSVEEAETRTTQTVRVYADGTYEVIDTTISTDEDGLTSAKVSNGGKVSYDALDEAQKRAVSDVAVIGDTGIVLNYSVTDGLPSSIDRDALKKLAEDNADLIEHLVFKTEKFNPDKYDGSVSMSFGFDSNAVIDRLDGQTKDIVVFELMAKDGDEGDGTAAPVLVASECDLDNEEQTVTLIPSVISTTATDKSDGDHSLMAGKDAVITDHVTYENLIPGKEYTLKASLMDKETGELLSVNDQHVTAEMKFTPNSQNGTVDIDLGKFDASALDGHDLVVFEELYKQTSDGDAPVDVLVAEHKDLDDEGQTVSVTSSPLGGFFGKTGGNSFFATVAVAALVVLAGGCAVYGVKTRRKAKDGQTDTDHDGGKDEEA